MTDWQQLMDDSWPAVLRDPPGWPDHIVEKERRRYFNAVLEKARRTFMMPAWRGWNKGPKPTAWNDRIQRRKACRSDRTFFYNPVWVEGIANRRLDRQFRRDHRASLFWQTW